MDFTTNQVIVTTAIPSSVSNIVAEAQDLQGALRSIGDSVNTILGRDAVTLKTTTEVKTEAVKASWTPIVAVILTGVAIWYLFLKR